MTSTSPETSTSAESAAPSNAFVDTYRDARIPASGPIDTRAISATPTQSSDLNPIWKSVIKELRVRSNDVHLPISLAYAERLCAAYPEADSLVVRVAVLLHDTGWGRVDESRIISEGFAGDWRRANIRFEHEFQGCEIAREVLPGLGYSDEFIAKVTAIIDGHDTRQVAHSLEDALMRDADRAWRFDHVGIALASAWFEIDPASYTDRLHSEILGEFITEAGHAMALADLERSEALLNTAVLR